MLRKIEKYQEDYLVHFCSKKGYNCHDGTIKIHSFIFIWKTVRIKRQGFSSKDSYGICI